MLSRICGYKNEENHRKGKDERMNIVVLAGGISTERDVSLISGQKIYQAIKGNGHHAVLLDVFLGYEGDISHIIV